jgi:VWFA-related protein
MSKSGAALVLSIAALAAVAKSPRIEPQHPLLAFNIFAFDAKGAPVRDLRPDQVRIYDDGQLAPASFCLPLTGGALAAAAGPREYSNRPVGGSAPSTVILLDLLNSSASERGGAADEIGRALQQFSSGDHIYLYLVAQEGDLRPVRGLTASDGNWTATAPALIEKAMDDLNHLRPWDSQIDGLVRARKTLAAVRQLTADFAGKPGAKSLVWVSRGLPLLVPGRDSQLRDYEPLIQQLGTDLARSGIAVYGVDQSSPRVLFGRDGMQQISMLTAGQWLPMNGSAKAIRMALGESDAAYRLAYVPPVGRWDNKFHNLRVVAVDKSIHLRAIEGYYGDAESADPDQHFARAARGQADDPGIAIRAAASPSVVDKGATHFQVNVDAAGLSLTPGEETTGEFRVTLAYFSNGWQSKVAQEAPTQLRLSPAQRGAALRDGIPVGLDETIPAGVTMVRVVVRDAQSSAIGSLTIPIL